MTTHSIFRNTVRLVLAGAVGTGVQAQFSSLKDLAKKAKETKEQVQKATEGKAKELDGDAAGASLPGVALDTSTGSPRNPVSEAIRDKPRKSAIGTIAFYSEPPVDGKFTPRDSFAADDKIYALLQLKGPLSEILIPFLRYGLQNHVPCKILSVEDEPGSAKMDMAIDFNLPRDNNRILNQLNIPLDIVPDPANAAYKQWYVKLEKWHQNELEERSKWIARKLTALGTGTHKISLRVVAESAQEKNGYNHKWEPIAEGSFTLNVDEKGAGKLKFASEKDRWITAMPAAEMKDAALEKQMLQAIKRRGESRNILRLVITRRGWFIGRNKLTGVIEYRTISASVALKDGDGTCKIYSWTFSQQEIGGGKYGELEAQDPNQIGDNSIRFIECENVTK